MIINFSSLNDNQQRAVRWQNGPLLVLAGPGSGKTRVLTYRIARLIHESPNDRFRILALTFTNKAAAEMRERIQELVPESGARSLPTTFHSFCAELLRQHGHHIGLRPDFVILAQEGDRLAFLEETLQVAPTGIGQSAERLLPLLTRLLDLNVDPANAAEHLHNLGVADAGAVAATYSAYRKRLLEQNRLDFGALIAESLRLLQSNAGVRKQIHRVYTYVCVDEFQDTNLSQYNVLKELVPPESRNLFVVADDDQIIYQWNGASPARLEQLQSEFSMAVLQLPENYRCPPQVIDIANRLIVNNQNRPANKEALVAHKQRASDNVIRVMRFAHLQDETTWVASDIASRQRDERTRCAVLARTRKTLEAFLVALTEKGVDAYFSARKDEFASSQLSWLHSMLRLANARQDNEQLRRVCKSFYSLEGIRINPLDVASAASAFDGDYLRSWRHAVLNRAELHPASRKQVEQSVLALSDRLDFWTFIAASLAWFREIEGSVAVATEESDFAEEARVWQLLLDEIVGLHGREEITLHLLLQELDLRSKTPTPPRGAVPCLTIHASKGLEFGHVYLVAMVEDQLPSYSAVKKGPDSRELQEERRNCFVAITRAQESLTFSHSDEVFGWTKAPSRFLKEMGLP